MRLKHKSRSHRKPTARRSGWATFTHWFAGAEPGPCATDYRTLPPLPPGSMAQRDPEPWSPLPPVTHTYTGGLTATADLAGVARRVTASLRPAFRLDTKAPLFRDESTWEQFEDSHMERLRRIQQIAEGWPDEHGVNLGTDQSPRTLVFATSLYERFSDRTGMQPAVKR